MNTAQGRQAGKFYSVAHLPPLHQRLRHLGREAAEMERVNFVAVEGAQ